MSNIYCLIYSTFFIHKRGHYTCPAFQGYNSDTMFIGTKIFSIHSYLVCFQIYINFHVSLIILSLTGSSYEEENLLIETQKDKVIFVHIIGPEPHPLWPYSNFDSGKILTFRDCLKRINFTNTLYLKFIFLSLF